MRACIGKLMKIRISLLFVHIFEMNTSLVNADRSACFHPFRSYTPASDTFCEMVDSRFCASSAFDHFSSDVHETIEKCTGSDDNAFSMKFCIPNGTYTYCFTLFDNKLFCLILPYIEIWGVVNDRTPFPDKFTTITLGTRTPYCRPLSNVQHTKLDSCFISNESHISAKSIDFSNNLSFGDSPNGRITTHLSDFVHVHRHKARLSSHIGRSSSCFTPCMAAADNDDIIIKYHD